MRIVPVEDLANVWPKVEGWIAAALPHGAGDENSLDIFIRLARGDYALWYEQHQFAAVVQIVQQPRQRVATILYCGGRGLSAVQAAFHHGKAWAAANHVDVIRVYGREGWERALGLERVGTICQVVVKTP